ncbi:MAG: hypothetical protein Tsb0034_26640 [Ekhidna sp.]
MAVVLIHLFAIVQFGYLAADRIEKSKIMAMMTSNGVNQDQTSFHSCYTILNIGGCIDQLK